MAVTDFFAGEIATELLKQLIIICKKSCLCKSSAEQLVIYIEELLPVIQEIKYSGIELPQLRQSQLDRLTETLRSGLELAKKVLASSRWQVYKNLQLARKMEKLEKTVSRFVKGPLQAHILADVHHARFESGERFDRLEMSTRRIEEQLGAMKIGVSGGWMEEAVKMVEEEDIEESNLVNLGSGIALGKKKAKEMIIGRDDFGVVGICGLGGSGKTTLAREICRDQQVRSYFNNRVFFLTVSQSPDLEQLKQKLWELISGNNIIGLYPQVPQWKLQFDWRVGVRTLVVLDDVWSLSVLEQLIYRIPGCKTLVVSRFKFPTVVDSSFNVELLKDNEARSLFCYSAFRQKSIPPSGNEKLVQQVLAECKGLPLALKVIGASLRDKPEMFWTGAKNRLSRGEAISESHERNLLERMALSVLYLPEKVKECFLDLGSFPEDKKIPLDVLINIWVEVHDIDAEEAFAILIELAEKNLLTLVRDARAGDIYSSYFEIHVAQHDVLRDLALHLSNRGDINKRRRLLMPRRDGLPKDWERNMDQPFNAQIVSIHTGEMREFDWFHMDFPKAEVLILNFFSSEYYLPPFIGSMPKLRALILINYGMSNAVLHNFSVFRELGNLRSLWLEKVTVPALPAATFHLSSLQKLSLVLCKVKNILHGSAVDLPMVFSRLSELTMDHCIDLIEMPLSICQVRSLKSLSITNCHSLLELPIDIGMLSSLEILRIYACPALKKLPSRISELVWLKYLDISQCINLRSLPESIGKLIRLEKIDMRECPHIRNLPKSTASLQSLSRVICDEEVALSWKQLGKDIPALQVQVAEEFFSLNWLVE